MIQDRVLWIGVPNGCPQRYRSWLVDDLGPLPARTRPVSQQPDVQCGGGGDDVLEWLCGVEAGCHLFPHCPISVPSQPILHPQKQCSTVLLPPAIVVFWLADDTALSRSTATAPSPPPHLTQLSTSNLSKLGCLPYQGILHRLCVARIAPEIT